MDVPADLKYTPEHEWVRVEGDRATVGITDYAQDALGDIVYVELPAVGRKVRSNEAFCEVESTKSVSDVYAPVSGEVVEVNGGLADAPQRINEAPYGDGWLCVIALDDASELDDLLDAAAYTRLIEQE